MPHDFRHGHEDGHGDQSLAAAGGNEEVEDGLNHQHGDAGNRSGQIGHQGNQAVNDGVSNLAVIHDDGDAAGQTDSHGGNEHGLRAGQQAVSNLTAAEAGDDAADDAADEVHSSHLKEAPAPLQAAVYHQGDGDDEHHQNQLAAQGEFQLRIGGVLQVGVVVAVHDALGGVLLDHSA